MVSYRYLTSSHLQGFSTYKYCAKETSPLAVYIILPTWDRLVTLMPMWVAPNLLTFMGWILVMFDFCLLSFYDWDYNTSTSNSVFNRTPIPAAIWVFCGISQFLSYFLDGIDGKQARRTSSSTPLGELFDHGCDSWVAIVLPLSLMSALGRGSKWGGSPHVAVMPCLCTLAGFYFCHWEKYITGCLFLPWAYDLIQIASVVAYLMTGIYGVELWHFYVLPGWNVAFILRWFLIIGFLISVPVSLWNIYEFYAGSGASDDQQQPKKASGSPTTSSEQHKLGFLSAIAPWLPFMIFASLYLIWIKLSLTDIIEREPRIMLLSMGVVFSNIACRLIVSQMTSQHAELFNILLIPLLVVVYLSFLLPTYEVIFLYVYFAVVLMAHLHYAISIVGEMCKHFNIYAFSLAKREQTS